MQQIKGEMLDITAPELPVEIQIRYDGTVLWVHVDGATVLRICKIKSLIMQDDRPKEKQELSTS